MKEKVKDKRREDREKRRERTRREKKQDKISPKCFEKKKTPSDELFLHFVCKKCRIWPFLNYLHDSNSIFWAQGIKSEWVFGRTEKVKV